MFVELILIFGLNHNHIQDELYCDYYVKIFEELAKNYNGMSLAHLAENNPNYSWKHEWRVEKIIKGSVSSTRSAMF